MSAESARAKLDSARKFRMLAEVEKCAEHSQAAHFLALDAADYETAYHAYACMGKMHLWRAEYDLAYVQYREALRVAEGFGLTKWISPAHQDCLISGAEAGYGPCMETNAEPALEDWRLPGSRTWALVHDIYRALVRGKVGKKARYHAVEWLRQSAISAMWCIQQPPPGGPWWPDYKAKFERVAVNATMVHACGILVGEGSLPASHVQKALDLFEMAADDLSSDEGYALNLIDAAQGTRAGGMLETARELLARAHIVASRRGEDRITAEVRALREKWNDTP